MILVSPASTLKAATSGRLIAFAAMLVFLTAMLGIVLRPIGYLSIFWPANQLLLVLLLRYPRQLLQPLGLTAIFLSFVTADLITGGQLWVTVGFTIANVAGALCGWYILRNQSERNLLMEGQYSALMVFFASGVAALVSAAIGGPIGAYAFNAEVIKSLLMWWTGEWMNAMILLPFLLALPTASKLRSQATPASLSGPMVLMPLIAVFLLEAASYTVGSKVGSLVFSLPALLWCALAYPIVVTAIVTMLVFATKIIAAQAGFMDFTPDHYLDAATFRLGVTMLILGPLSVAGSHATRTELLQQLKYQANHDSLTSVFSRNGFVQASNALLKRLKHDKAPVAVLMLDLDHFKRVNDSYGHATGDLLLRNFSETMMQTLRPQDVLGRIGGKSLLWCCPKSAPKTPSSSPNACATLCVRAITSPPITIPCMPPSASGCRTSRTCAKAILSKTCCAMPTRPCTRPKPVAATA